MKKKNQEYDVTQNPLYHDTWKLLRKYRDVVWSLELSVQQVRSKFQIEYGSSIEDFLESIYLAGADLSGSEIELEYHVKNEGVLRLTVTASTKTTSAAPAVTPPEGAAVLPAEDLWNLE